MAYCGYCGAQIGKLGEPCPACGKIFTDGTFAGNGFKEEKVGGMNGFFQKLKVFFFGTEDETNRFSYSDINETKLVSASAYFIFFLPLIFSQTSPFARFHANQGLLLFISFLIVGIINWMIGWIPLLGWLVVTLLRIALIICLAVGVVNTAEGKAKRLPLIGRFSFIK